MSGQDTPWGTKCIGLSSNQLPTTRAYRSHCPDLGILWVTLFSQFLIKGLKKNCSQAETVIIHLLNKYLIILCYIPISVLSGHLKMNNKKQKNSQMLYLKLWECFPSYNDGVGNTDQSICRKQLEKLAKYLIPHLFVGIRDIPK